MKHQALFSPKDRSKKIKVSSAAILLGALRVNKISETDNAVALGVCDHLVKNQSFHSLNIVLTFNMPFSKWTLLLTYFIRKTTNIMVLMVGLVE